MELELDMKLESRRKAAFCLGMQIADGEEFVVSEKTLAFAQV